MKYDHAERTTEIYRGKYGLFSIYQDKETGVQYLITRAGNVCVVVDADGMPYTGAKRGDEK